MDRRLQELERRWRALGTPEAGLVYLLAFERTASDEQVLDLLRRVGVRRWRLVGVDGSVEGQVLPLLREAVYRLGPEPDADLTLPAPVEGHVVLEVRQRGVERTCEVTGGDGVLVEGQPLAGPRALADGDLLELDGARFVVEAAPDTPDDRAPATRRGWLTVVAPPARAGERVAFSDHTPLARLVPGDARHVEWDPGQRRWVVRRLEGPAAPLAAGRVLAMSGVEVRFVGLPDAVARADLRAHVERALARQRPRAQAGSILMTDGPDAGRAVPLVRGDNPLPGSSDGVAVEVDLDDDDPTRWVVRARSVPPGAAWSVRGGGLYQGPDDGEVQPGRVVARSRGGRRELRGERAYELAVGEPLAPLVDAYLVVTDGPDAGLRFALRVGATRLGADGDSDLVLTDPAARGREALIEVRRGWRPTYDPPAWGPRFTWRPAGEREDRPLEDGDAVEVGATRLVLRACSVGGPPRAWLTRLEGPRPGEAFPVDEFGLSFAALPWAAWDLAREQARLGSCLLRVDDEVLRLVGPEAAIEGAPARADLRDGDVILVGGVRLRFERSTPGAPVEGARLRPEPDPAAAPPATAQVASTTTPPHRVARDVDLKTWTPALALSPAGELAVVGKDEVALHAPDGARRWTRPGGRTSEPWQPEPQAVAFDRDGRLLVAYGDGLLEVLALDDGRTLEQLRPPTKDAMIYLSATLVASPTEPLALVVGPADAGSFEGTRELRVVAWDLAAREVRWTHELTVGRQYPRPVLPATRGVFYWHVDRCRPGGFEFVDSVTSRGSTVDGTTEPLPHPEGRPVSALADLDDEHLLVVAGGRLARWRREPPHELDWFAGDGGEARRGPLAISPDRRFAAVAGEQLLELWHLGARRRLHVAPLAGDRVLALELRDDGHAFVITFPSRLRVVAFDLTATPPPRMDAGPPPPLGASAPEGDVARRRALAGSESTTIESTLKKAGDWFRGLLFEGP